MASLNKVFLIGNLTRDPEVRYIATGKAVAKLGLAVNRRYKSATGELKEETCFVDIEVWERQAETAGEYLKKGSPVLVEGTLKFDTWESNGEKRSRLMVRAERLQFLDRAARRADAGAAGADDTGARAARPAAAPAAPEGAGAEPAAAAGAKSDEDDLPF